MSDIICIAITKLELDQLTVEITGSSDDGTYTAGSTGDILMFNLANLPPNEYLGATDGLTNNSFFSKGEGPSTMYFFLTAACYKITNNVMPETPMKIEIYTGGDHPEPIIIESSDTKWFDHTGENTSFQDTPCCVHEDTLIKTDRGILKIQDIRKDDKVLTLNDEFVDVIYNIKYITTNKFVKIEKDAFDTNCPENDLYITGAHPIYLNGTEIEVRHLVNGKTITNVELEKSVHVYSLCTKDRYPVLMDGLMVMTWSQVDWEKASKKSKMIEWRL